MAQVEILFAEAHDELKTQQLAAQVLHKQFRVKGSNPRVWRPVFYRRRAAEKGKIGDGQTQEKAIRKTTHRRSETGNAQKHKKKIKPSVAMIKTVSPSSRLEVVAQRVFTATPQYRLLAERGSDPSKFFKIAAVIGNHHYPAAWGRRKKEAEEKAAMNALAVINGEPIPYQETESPSSRLEEVAQKEFTATPQYQLLDEKGPDHSKCFKIAAVIGKYHYPAAWGRRKKEAEEKAAMNALAVINGEPIPFQERKKRR